MNTLVLEHVQVASGKYPRVAQTLKELRSAADLTQEAVAHEVGLTLSGYRGYEQGKRDLKSEQIERFAEIFKVPVSEITARLWPEDAQLVETRYSNDFAELQREIADLPDEQQARVLRGFWHSVEIARGGELARRN